MDVFSVIIHILIHSVITLWLFIRFSKRKNETDRFFGLKRLLADCWNSRRIRSRTKAAELLPTRMNELIDGFEQKSYDSNVINYYGVDRKNNFIFIRISRRKDKYGELELFLGLKDGQCYELPDYPNTVINDALNSSWSGAGLKITILEPTRRTRIIFNGLLRNGNRREIDNYSNDNIEHMRFNCIFIANTHPYSRDEFWSAKLQSETLARNSWNKCKWQQLIANLDYDEVDQYGSMMAQITFEDSSMVELYLRGLRQSHWGQCHGAYFDRNVCITAINSLGFSFYINLADVKDGMRHNSDMVENSTVDLNETWKLPEHSVDSLLEEKIENTFHDTHSNNNLNFINNHIENNLNRKANALTEYDTNQSVLKEKNLNTACNNKKRTTSSNNTVENSENIRTKTLKVPQNTLNHKEQSELHESIRLGHVKKPSDELYTIDSLNFNAEEFMNRYESGLNEYAFEFTAGIDTYEATIKLRRKTERITYGGYPWDSQYIHCSFRFKLNDASGIGLIHLWKPYSSFCPIKLAPIKTSVRTKDFDDDPEVYVLSFLDERCQNEKLVGGKGASLAELSSIKTTQFTVPQGFCVTAHALDAHIKHHAKLDEVIDDFVKVCSGEKIGSLTEYSERVVTLMQNTPVLESVQKVLLNKFKQLNMAEHKCSFAVRSSAVGEDSEDTSAAGQNSTYLGIKDVNEVIKYVSYCWGSLFTHQSVEYRRQHGLPVRVSMGVCVQQMVNADAAGVMFTRHPMTGNPKEIFITSNYGLGESVVSALVDPDTIIIQRNLSNKLKIKTSTIGKKSEKIIVDDSGGGTQHQNLSDREKMELSVNPDVSLRLAQIGVDLEEIFKGPRDIEWAVCDTRIYLLQCRPVTALDTWTDFELIHELGSGVPCDKDILTFANVGEVFPMAVAPLTVSTVIYALNTATEAISSRKPLKPTYINHIFIANMRCTINYINLLFRNVADKISLGDRVMEIAVSGHMMITPEIHEIAKRRNGVMSLSCRMIFFKNISLDLWRNQDLVERARAVTEKCRLEPKLSKLSEMSSAKDIYASLTKLIDIFCQICYLHSHTSKNSIFYQVLMMSILTEGNENFTTEHYSDIALLLDSCSNVVSAQVPIILRDIAHLIKESGLGETFKNIDVSEALDWLLLNCPKAYEQVQEFIKMHGYRGIEEFDLITETWGMRPEKFLSTIQSLMHIGTESTSDNSKSKIKNLTPEETVSQLKTPQKRSTRWILRAVLPASRKAVVRREITKAYVIEIVHYLRQGYRRLASLLKLQGKLPEEDLVFFLTHSELAFLIVASSPTLVRKAARRRKIRPSLQAHKYNEFNHGLPKPIEPTSLATLGDGARIQGTSVCNGIVTGRACVALTLEEAADLRPGDVLITTATDIGWSPYFPLLGGVVTELGGLISHGAVVAREYGLPCIVSAQNATRMINTGETVILNGYAGTIEVLKKIS